MQILVHSTSGTHIPLPTLRLLPVLVAFDFTYPDYTSFPQSLDSAQGHAAAERATLKRRLKRDATAEQNSTLKV